MAYINESNMRIRGISACVPEHVEENIESNLLPKEELERFIQTTGIERRHTVPKGMCTSDLCQHAAEKLLGELHWSKDEIDMLIFISHTTDYRLPSTSCLLQDRMGLPVSTMCFDITLGCSGFIYGLSLISRLLSPKVKKALIMVGNTQSVLMSPKDKSTYLLFGDAGTVTAVEYVEKDGDVLYSNCSTDGSGGKYTIIPDGGCRNPITPESFIEEEKEKGIIRSRAQYHMDGVEVFSYGINGVPKCVNQLYEQYGLNSEKLDYFLIHQANKFMCEKIRKKLKISADITPYNIHNFGNTSGATIPLLMVTNLKNDLYSKDLNLLLATVGVGFSFGATYLQTHKGIICPDLYTL